LVGFYFTIVKKNGGVAGDGVCGEDGGWFSARDGGTVFGEGWGCGEEGEWGCGRMGGRFCGLRRGWGMVFGEDGDKGP